MNEGEEGSKSLLRKLLLSEDEGEANEAPKKKRKRVIYKRGLSFGEICMRKLFDNDEKILGEIRAVQNLSNNYLQRLIPSVTPRLNPQPSNNNLKPKEDELPDTPEIRKHHIEKLIRHLNEPELPT